METSEGVTFFPPALASLINSSTTSKSCGIAVERPVNSLMIPAFRAAPSSSESYFPSRNREGGGRFAVLNNWAIFLKILPDAIVMERAGRSLSNKLAGDDNRGDLIIA